MSAYVPIPIGLTNIRPRKRPRHVGSSWKPKTRKQNRGGLVKNVGRRRRRRRRRAPRRRVSRKQ